MSDKSVRTGREAIAIGYGLIDDILVKGKGEKPFFISLSIAPLFPCGYGHARRFSCDAFGTMEDVEYVLNAQTYAWWQSGRLYQYNDPDHICLLRSFGMERDSTQGEARARYTASAIAGMKGRKQERGRCSWQETGRSTEWPLPGFPFFR